MRSRLATLALLLSLSSCQAGVWKEAGDSSAKGGMVGGGAAAGAALGGPMGALVGGVLAYFGIELAEVRVERNEAVTLAAATQSEAADRERQAQAAGAQQASDNANASLATMMNNPQLAEMFSTKAAEATKPLQDALDTARSELIGEIMRWVWKFVFLITALITAYLAKQWWGSKRLERKFVRVAPEPP